MGFSLLHIIYPYIRSSHFVKSAIQSHMTVEISFFRDLKVLFLDSGIYFLEKLPGFEL